MGQKIKVTGTRVGADGTGYFRGENGKYYYGNLQNGYLTETKQLQQAHAKKQSQPQHTASSYSKNNSRTSEGSGDLDSLLGCLVAGAFGAGMIAVFFISLFTSLVFAWPWFVKLLADHYRTGRVDLVVGVLTAILVFLVGYFILSVCRVITTKQMRSRRYIIVCTASITAPFVLIAIFLGQPGLIFTYAVQGLTLSALPAFILCFVEHLATKKMRRDNEWFISKIARLLSRVFIGHAAGMVIFGVLVVLFSAMYSFSLSLISSDGGDALHLL